MFGINGWEFVVLAVIALLVLGPEKLPKFAADAARTVRQLRRMASDARAEVTRELGPEFQDISLQDLNPRTFVSKHLLDDDDLDLGLGDDDEAPARPAGNGQAGRGRPRTGSSAAPRQPKRPTRPGHGGGRGAGGAGSGGAGSGGAPAPPERPPYDADAT
jgi:sec-independent protein translocase protein TatB